ncbi:MAG: holo-ACP synthase [Syntrophales bacterium]
MIAGMGIDLVEVRRIDRLLGKWGDRFTGRFFAAGEIAYCGNKARPAIHYAARFAAKESFLKSLGIGLGMGVHLRDIEVSRDRRGKPALVLHGRAASMLADRGVTAVHLSLTHTAEHAAATVVLEAGAKRKAERKRRVRE